MSHGLDFRSFQGTPFDHTSILATLREWTNLKLNPKAFLPSQRIARAPILDPILSSSIQIKDWPVIKARTRWWWSDKSPRLKLNDLQIGLLAHMRRKDLGDGGPDNMKVHTVATRASMETEGDALAYLKSKR
jgi:phospholipase C